MGCCVNDSSAAFHERLGVRPYFYSPLGTTREELRTQHKQRPILAHRKSLCRGLGPRTKAGLGYIGGADGADREKSLRILRCRRGQPGEPSPGALRKAQAWQEQLPRHVPEGHGERQRRQRQEQGARAGVAGYFEKTHEEIQNQSKCKPHSEAIQARLADQFNHLPCAETIRKATKGRYEAKASVQKPIASLRTRGERNAFAAAEAALWRQRGFAVPEQP